MRVPYNNYTYRYMPKQYIMRNPLYKRVNKKNNSVTFETKEVIDIKDYIEVDLKIPIMNGCKNEEVQEHINTSIENDQMEFKRQMEESAKLSSEEAKEEGRTMTPYVASTIYEVTYNKNNIISISIIYHEYVRGKHYYIKASYNYDLETGKSLALEDLFKEGVDYRQLIDNEVRKQILLNQDKYYPDAITRFKGIAEDQPFYLDGDNIVVFFGFHEIAPLVSEIPVFKIPFSTFHNEIKPIFLNDELTRRYPYPYNYFF